MACGEATRPRQAMGDVSVSPVNEASAAQQMAARLAAITDIRDVRLMKSCAEIVRLPVADPFLAYQLDSEAAVKYELGSESFVVRGTYRVSIRSTSTADVEDHTQDPDAAVARSEFEQAALF